MTLHTGDELARKRERDQGLISEEHQYQVLGLGDMG